MADYDVIVVGGGLGGLSAGALLAKSGRKVLVLEQSDVVGGCCSTFEKDGFRFDLGASIVEAIKNMHIFFDRMGTSLEKEIELLPCDPVYTAIFRDGSKVTYYKDLDKTADAIGAISPVDKGNFYRYASKFAEFIEQGGEDYFTAPMNTLGDFISLIRRRPVIARFFPFFLASYQDILKHYFSDERILQSMAYQSFYAGHPPDLAPGIFAILPYFEHLGVFYPRGGMSAIPEAICRVGKAAGMEVRCNTPVTRVLVDGLKRARAVRLQDGSIVTANAIVSNVNAKTLYLDMIGEEHLPWLARTGIKSYEPSLTCPMIYLGLDYRPPLDAHHTIIPLSLDKMNDAWWNFYRQGKIPPEQFGLICFPTYTDPSLAPKGHHILNLILMGPYKLTATNWDREKPRFIEETIKFLDDFCIPGLSAHVKVAEMSSPLDFERQLRLPGGAIYGLQEDLMAQSVLRPAGKSKSIGCLYLTGASTHPGGGVPTSIGSGMIAADQIGGSVQ